MQIILVRHGSTCASGDKGVWGGARSDLPLVDKCLRLSVARAVTLQDAAVVLSNKLFDANCVSP